MKNKNILTVIAVIMLILIITLISFLGIYTKDKNKMINIVPDYLYSLDYSTRRIAKISIDTSSETVYYDSEGNEVDEEAENGSSKEVPVNAEEVLTAENFEKAKAITDFNGIPELLMDIYGRKVTISKGAEISANLVRNFLAAA